MAPKEVELVLVREEAPLFRPLIEPTQPRDGSIAKLVLSEIASQLTIETRLLSREAALLHLLDVLRDKVRDVETEPGQGGESLLVQRTLTEVRIAVARLHRE
ncbi:MAG: hypothetical protein ABFS46_08825 [Myxococcota bacterium]